MGSGEVFSITDDPLKSSPDPMLEDDEWQDVEVSEEWGPQTPLTPLNDEDDDDEDQDDQGDPDDLIQMRHSSGSASRNMIDSRYSVR